MGHRQARTHNPTWAWGERAISASSEPAGRTLGIFIDCNLNQLALMAALGETAKRLDFTRGRGRYGPREFVDEFARHFDAQAILSSLPSEEAKESQVVAVRGQPVAPIRRIDQGFSTDLAEELIVPESWLFEHQDTKNGPFIHIMDLFSADRIGTLALNLVDANGFRELSEALGRIADGHVPGLKDASIATVFLANLISHIAAPNGYFKFGDLDKTPRGALSTAWSNIELVAPNNPYVVFADRYVKSMLDEPSGPLMDRRLIDGPTAEHMELGRHAIGQNEPTLKIVAFHSATDSHHCDWHPGNQATMGGRLDVVKDLLNGLHVGPAGRMSPDSGSIAVR